nr:proline-rich proteoglycan 2-like [Penaeus vannamei]
MPPPHVLIPGPKQDPPRPRHPRELGLGGAEKQVASRAARSPPPPESELPFAVEKGTPSGGKRMKLKDTRGRSRNPAGAPAGTPAGNPAPQRSPQQESRSPQQDPPAGEQEPPPAPGSGRRDGEEWISSSPLRPLTPLPHCP